MHGRHVTPIRVKLHTPNYTLIDAVAGCGSKKLYILRKLEIFKQEPNTSDHRYASDLRHFNLALLWWVQCRSVEKQLGPTG